MKSIKNPTFGSHSDSLIYVILSFTSTVLCSPSCGLYGAPPCQFLPAPPGQTPSCARPGKTYCERIDNYPTYLIKHLVHKWGYEAKNLIVDETWDEFASLSWHETSHFYDPAFIFPQRNEDASFGGQFGGYKYNTPPLATGSADAAATRHSSDYGGENALFTTRTTETPTFLLYSAASQRASKKQLQAAYSSSSSGSSSGSGSASITQVTPNNPTLWLKRIVRELSEQRAGNRSVVYPVASATAAETVATAAETVATAAETVATAAETVATTRGRDDVSANLDLLDVVGVVEREGRRRRVKRQSEGEGRTSLCRTTSRFVAPQAALNSKGNWMFVVNEMNTARQMVKTELCASSSCANLCQLPNNYDARCEQKFVQKRLIALQASGRNLYTDTFWFPSCCVCTISAN